MRGMFSGYSEFMELVYKLRRISKEYRGRSETDTNYRELSKEEFDKRKTIFQSKYLINFREVRI